MSDTIQISGEIAFETSAPALDNWTLVVRIEDQGLPGAPAQIIAETVNHGVQRDANGTIPFSLEATLPENPAARYGLRAHVRQHSAGDIRKGDYVSKTSYPLKSDKLTGLRIQVERV